MDANKLTLSHISFLFIVGVTVSSFVYNGDFNFFIQPISELGQFQTDAGQVNIFGLSIFTLTCELTAISIFIAALQKKDIFLGITGLGMIFMPIPCDLFLMGHQIASGFVVGGLYFFTATSLYKSHQHKTISTLLHITVLSYAALHLSGSVWKEEVQTFAVSFLLISLMIIEPPQNSQIRKILHRHS